MKKPYGNYRNRLKSMEMREKIGILKAILRLYNKNRSFAQPLSTTGANILVNVYFWGLS